MNHLSIFFTFFSQDRCIIVPRVGGADDVCLLGVFDGTVGDNAAEFCHMKFQDALLGNRFFAESVAASKTGTNGFLTPLAISKMEAAMLEGYRSCDEALLKMCADAVPTIDYSSCTSVTALVSGKMLTCAHLGDSKIVLGREIGGVMQGKGLTTDHKPDMIEERRRIEKSGGSLAFLHGGKPFIRGGDFSERQLKGDRPMQLNYSRAFGGKDLKMFGLSAVPDILQVQLTPADRLIILASDGLWDVSTADVAVRRAWESLKAGRDPALDLTDWALDQHDLRGSVDNVTVIVMVLKPLTS
jgi:serine/threonine protein phosphatase PrpC